jgi:phage terminase small subunit
MGLTLKQESFCNKYLETGNASEAYRFAYNCLKQKSETVNRNAFNLSNRNKIITRLNELRAELKASSDITKNDILNELSAILKSNIRDYVKFDGSVVTFKSFEELTDSQSRAIESIKKTKNGIELKLHGKSWSIERICKMLGFDAPIKGELTGANGTPLIPQTIKWGEKIITI